MQAALALMMSVIAWYRFSPQDAWVNQDNNPAYLFVLVFSIFIYALIQMAKFSHSIFRSYLATMVTTFFVIALTFFGSVYLLSLLIDRLDRNFTDSNLFVLVALFFVLLLPAILGTVVVHKGDKWFKEK